MIRAFVWLLSPAMVAATACSGSATPPPIAPVSAESPIDAAQVVVEEREPDGPDDGEHVLPEAPEKRGRVVVTTSDACGMIIQPVYFAQDSATPAANAPVDEIADMLICANKDDGLLLELAVQGHADASERDADALAMKRAQTVATMLTARKMPSSGPLVIEPYGAHRPVDTTGTADGRARNRRVEFLILGRTSKSD